MAAKRSQMIAVGDERQRETYGMQTPYVLARNWLQPSDKDQRT